MRKVAGTLVLALSLALCGCGTQDSGAYGRGAAALQQGDYSTAIEEFQTAADQDGRAAEAYRGQGIACLRQGEYARAVTLFSLSLEEMKHSNKEFSRDVLFYQAEAYEKNGQSGEAEAIYTELTEDGGDARAFVLRGRGKLQGGDTVGAREDFESALDCDGSYEVYLQIYQAYTAVNREADGADYLERALESAPGDAEDYKYQAQVHYYLGDYEKAKEDLSKAGEEEDDESRLLLGKLCLETEDAAAARSVYQNYLENGERPAEAYNGLALCDIQEKDYDSALQNIRRGIECGDEEAMRDLLYNEIVVYEYQLDFVTAKSKMKEFLEKYPGDEDAVRENIFLQSR